MSIGKNPHRPEGKANTDNEHMAAWKKEGAPYMGNPSEKEVHEKNMANKDRVGERHSPEDSTQIGGSRPGVESRVKEAINEREDREEQEES